MAKSTKTDDPLKAREQKRAKKRHKKKVSVFRDKRNRYLVFGVATFALIVGGLLLFVQLRPGAQTEVQQEAAQFREADELFAEGKFIEAADAFYALAQEQTGESKFNNLMRAGEAWQRGENFQRSLEAYNEALEVREIPEVFLLEAYAFAADASIAAEEYESAIDFLNRHKELLNNLPEDAEVGQIEERIAAVDNELAYVADLQQEGGIEGIERRISEYEALLPDERGATVAEEDAEKIVEALRAIVEYAENNTLPSAYENTIADYKAELEVHEETEASQNQEPPPPPPPGGQQ